MGKSSAVPRKDIVVYGGATFVSSLIENDLIDELNFFVNPVAIGRGNGRIRVEKAIRAFASTAYPCGTVVNRHT